MNQPPSAPDETANDMDLTMSAFAEGKYEGQQEVYKTFATFLKKRMIAHFEDKNDELAKELREIYLLTKENIKE
jgi:hypothetical protein